MTLVMFKKLVPEAVLPRMATEMSGAFDVVTTSEHVVIEPGKSAEVGTGLAMALQPGWRAEFRGRSGLAFIEHVLVFNGVIDADYRGELKVLLTNTGNYCISIFAGQRVAQLVFVPVPEVTIVLASELDGIEAEHLGFGSTGR